MECQPPEKYSSAQPATNKPTDTGKTPTRSGLSKIKGDGLHKVNTHQILQKYKRPNQYVLLV